MRFCFLSQLLLGLLTWRLKFTMKPFLFIIPLILTWLLCHISETLSHAHGNYSDDTVRRAGKLVGTLARALDEAFHVNVAESTMQTSYHHRYNYHEDIEIFVDTYLEDELFTNHPGREHTTFPQFCAKTDIINPEQLKRRLIKYTTNLDRARDALEM